MTKSVDMATKKRQFAAKKAGYLADPVSFVVERFKVTPDDWQAEVLRALAANHRIAMSACKGPGKSCLMAWIGWYLLSLHTLSKGIAVSITRENLRDGLWTELAYWQGRDPFLTANFDLNSDAIRSKWRPKTWWLSARGFAADADKTQQANTLAGLHAPVVFALLDEAGDYPEGVVAAAEGIHSVEGQQAWTVMGGNPTRVDGPLYTACNSDRARWHVTHITGDPEDPKRSPRISMEWAEQQIALWGRDNPWVMVNVLGLFPPTSSNTLISVNDVTNAMQRDVRPTDIAADAHVWGLDPARFGDDEQVLTRRKGLVSWRPDVYRNLDGVQLADQIALQLQKFEDHGDPCDCLFVDVGGVGCSVFDHLAFLGWGYLMVAVDFGGAPTDPRFLNKRAEMWWNMSEWLRKRPCGVPNDVVLAKELPGPRFSFKVSGKQTKFVLESKEDMKSRGLSSPNRADSLALTFTGGVVRRAKALVREHHAERAKTEYNVLGLGSSQSRDKARTEYRIFGGS